MTPARTVPSARQHVICSGTSSRRWHPRPAWPAHPGVPPVRRGRRQARHSGAEGVSRPAPGSHWRCPAAASAATAAATASSPVAEWLFVAGTLYTLPFFLLVSAVLCCPDSSLLEQTTSFLHGRGEIVNKLNHRRGARRADDPGAGLAGHAAPAAARRHLRAPGSHLRRPAGQVMVAGHPQPHDARQLPAGLCRRAAASCCLPVTPARTPA